MTRRVASTPLPAIWIRTRRRLWSAFWLDALNAADVDGIAAILADDFLRLAPDSGRFITKADLLGFYRAHLLPQRSDPRRIEGLSVSVYGATAIARGVVITADSEARVVRKLTIHRRIRAARRKVASRLGAGESSHLKRLASQNRKPVALRAILFYAWVLARSQKSGLGPCVIKEEPGVKPSRTPARANCDSVGDLEGRRAPTG